jgi:hypothetical protein
MAHVKDIARLKIITYRAIKTTGTLIVNYLQLFSSPHQPDGLKY